jgi:hypothetical protein
VPNELKSCVRKKNCKYDIEKHKWYTTDKNNTITKDFSKNSIDFWALMNDLGVSYDKKINVGIHFILMKKLIKITFIK